MALATTTPRVSAFRQTPCSRARCVRVAAVQHNQQPGKALLASAAAAVLLATSSPALAATQPSLTPGNPGAGVASETAAGASKGFFTKLLDALPSDFPKVAEDPFGADRAQDKEVADTKRPIAIPTEQEAVAPEAFPNPSELRSEKPPVLAAAEGDEHLGKNAGQFADLDASSHQELIDKKSPAQSSTN